MLKRISPFSRLLPEEYELKHPALTRLFAVLLAVLCLTMLLAGLGSVGGALSERKKGREDLERLNGRIEEYRQILDDLEGGESYEQANLALRDRQGKHDGRASRHRMDLAVYTATRGGIRSGKAALFQAEQALAEGRAQLEAGRAEFEAQEALFWEGYEQFQEGKRQLQEARNTLNLAQTALADIRSQLDQMSALGAILDSDDPDARQELTVAAYDGLLQSLDQASSLYAGVKDQGGVSPEQLQMLTAMLAQQGVDTSWIPEDLELEGISTESMQAMEDRVAGETGMTLEEIRASIQSQRDSVAGMDGDEPLTEEQFAELQALYAANRDLVQGALNAMSGALAVYEGQVADAQAQLDEAQAQMDAMEEQLEQGKTAIEEGRAALDEAEAQLEQGEQALLIGRWQIWEKEQELDEQEGELLQEKEELDTEADELLEQTARTQARKDLEDREASVRLQLLERDEIYDRKEDGMDVLSAAEDYAAAYGQEIEETAKGRLLAGGLMVLGGLAGLIGIPAAFEKTKSRFWLIAPVLLCLLCAAGAEVLCRMLGRGDSYSALAAGGFALIQLALVIPKKKSVA